MIDVYGFRTFITSANTVCIDATYAGRLRFWHRNYHKVEIIKKSEHYKGRVKITQEACEDYLMRTT